MPHRIAPIHEKLLDFGFTEAEVARLARTTNLSKSYMAVLRRDIRIFESLASKMRGAQLSFKFDLSNISQRRLLPLINFANSYGYMAVEPAKPAKLPYPANFNPMLYTFQRKRYGA